MSSEGGVSTTSQGDDVTGGDGNLEIVLPAVLVPVFIGVVALGILAALVGSAVSYYRWRLSQESNLLKGRIFKKMHTLS